MTRLRLRYSLGGAIAAGLFLAAFAAAFAWLFFVASKNPADSGESGILLIFFAMPWIQLVPTSWLGLPFAFGSVLLNAVLLYCLFGGLRLRKP